jgi:hypothetical protein
MPRDGLRSSRIVEHFQPAELTRRVALDGEEASAYIAATPYRSPISNGHRRLHGNRNRRI